MFSHFRFSHVHDKLKFYTSDLSYNRPVARIFRGGGGGGVRIPQESGPKFNKWYVMHASSDNTRVECRVFASAKGASL